MPLPKNTSKKIKHSARLQRYHTRKAAENYFGKRAIKGKHIHHKNGNKNDNRKRNLQIVDRKTHGKRHGRGRKGSTKGDISFSFKKRWKSFWGKTI